MLARALRGQSRYPVHIVGLWHLVGGFPRMSLVGIGALSSPVQSQCARVAVSAAHPPCGLRAEHLTTRHPPLGRRSYASFLPAAPSLPAPPIHVPVFRQCHTVPARQLQPLSIPSRGSYVCRPGIHRDTWHTVKLLRPATTLHSLCAALVAPWGRKHDLRMPGELLCTSLSQVM